MKKSFLLMASDYPDAIFERHVAVLLGDSWEDVLTMIGAKLVGKDDSGVLSLFVPKGILSESPFQVLRDEKEHFWRQGGERMDYELIELSLVCT